MDSVRPDGARERIREVFLQRIVKGKGLDEIVAATGHEPNPTPYAVLQLVEAGRLSLEGSVGPVRVNLAAQSTGDLAKPETATLKLDGRPL